MKRDKADREWSLAIRERDKWTCQRCGAVHARNSQGLHAMHMFSRGKPATRHDLLNGAAGCYGCHRWLDTHPDLKRTFFRDRLGDEVFEALERRSNQTKKGAA